MKIGTNVCQSHFLHLSSRFFIAACVKSARVKSHQSIRTKYTNRRSDKKHTFVTFRRIQRSFFGVLSHRKKRRYSTTHLQPAFSEFLRGKALCKHPCTEHCVSRPSQAVADAVIPSLQCENRFRNMFLLI